MVVVENTHQDLLRHMTSISLFGGYSVLSSTAIYSPKELKRFSSGTVLLIYMNTQWAKYGNILGKGS